MNVKGIGKNFLLCLLLLLFASCDVDNSIQRYEFEEQSSYRYDHEAHIFRIMDLRGDGSNLLITSHDIDAHSSIVIQSMEGKAISQINTSEGFVQSMVTLKDPTNQSPWLFFCYNDNRQVSLNAVQYEWQVPLLRTTKIFEPYTRNDYLKRVPAYQWRANILPQLLDDIDGDGKLELVCLAVSGYSANPRGLMVFDFESGKRKWFFRTPCNFYTLVFKDLDGDGQREFLLNNEAFNNTDATFNNLNDHSVYLTVLDPFGKVLDQHKIFEGIGESRMMVKDVDQDGTLDIYLLALTRGVDTKSDLILRLSFNGKKLIRTKELMLPKTLERVQGNDFLHRLDNSLKYYLVVNDSNKGLRLFDDLLNDITPREVKDVKKVVHVADLSSAKGKEIIVLTNSDEIKILNPDFKELAHLKNPFPDFQSIYLQVLTDPIRKEARIALLTKNNVDLYALERIALSNLIYQSFKAYNPLLVLLLVLILLRLAFQNRRQLTGIISTVNQLEEGLIIVSGKDKIIFINKAATSLILEEYPNSSLRSLRESLPLVSVTLISMRRSTADYENSNTVIASKPIRLHIEKIKGLRTRYLICLVKILPDEQIQHLEWAETARRLSHHVRRHITNILLALEAISDLESSANQEYLDIVKGEIEKIRVFTHAFQRFTEMQNYELKLHDVIPSVEHALTQVQLPNNLNLIKDYSLKSIPAYIEPIRFEEVLINTLNNSIEAMPDGGTLHITVKEFPRHRSPKGKLSILVEIEDTGKGIPAKYMEDIWKPFFTTNQSGTGIGIPENKKIIDSMGGLIDIQSEEGLGTTVSVWLKGEYDGSN